VPRRADVPEVRDDGEEVAVGREDAQPRVAMADPFRFDSIPTRTQPSNPCEYRVWFGTDRLPNVSNEYIHGFSKRKFDVRLHCGSCVVFVPVSHQVGSVGSNVIIRVAKTLVGRPVDDEPLRLVAIEQGDAESLSRDLSKLLSELPEICREVLLFVHGFNVSFEQAAIRAAQIGRDLALRGPMVFYSWPSKSRLAGYFSDESTISRTKPHFLEFMHILLRIPELRALNVLAHSMGNRLLHEVAELIELETRQARGLQFGHIILAAPDVDRETFKRAASAYAKLRSAQRRTTLYWNKSDFAIYLSHLLHFAPRAGRTGKAIPGTDSIRWAKSAFDLDLLGHGYFAAAKPVLDDMSQLLNEHAPPDKRANLKPFPSDHPLWWELRPVLPEKS
jgi:esterase/lipase superfamily enzyme